MLTDHDAGRRLERLLRRVGARVRRRRAWTAARAAMLATGALVAVVMAASQLFGVRPVLVPWLAGAAAVVIAAALVAYGWRLRRDHVARTIDRACGAAAPCSSTYMVLQRGAANRVEHALIGTLGEWSQRVDPKAVVPGVRIERWAVLAGLAWLAVGVAAVAPVPVLREPSRASASAAAGTDVWLASKDEETAVKLERFAELLYREAAVRDDEALAALARDAAALGERLRAGDLLASQAMSTFESLSEAVATSLGLANDPTYRPGDGLGDPSVGAGARPATNRERATPMLGQDRREEVGTTEAPREGERVLDSLLERLETDAIARATAEPDTDVSDVTFRRGVGATEGGNEFDSPYDDPNAEAPLDATPSPNQARPDRGGAAAGDAAGAGGVEAGGLAQDLTEGRDPGRALDAFDVDLEALTLPDREPPGARRLRVLAPPPVDPRSVDDATAGPPPPVGWAWSEEAFLGGHALSVSDRRHLAAAFRPESEDVRE